MILCWAAVVPLTFATNPLASIELRLITPLTSYDTRPGTGFEAVVTSSRADNGRLFLPPGTIVRGEVLKRKSVGMGIRHERASLEIEFQEYQLANGLRFPFEAKLRSLDNAREAVTETGAIRGVLAARTPHNYLQGVWHKPSVDLFQRSFIGLTGVSGRIFKVLNPGPFGAAAIFAVRVALFRMPEPEIQLAAGTEMRVQVDRVSEEAPWFDPASDLAIDEDIADWLQSRPASIRKSDGKVERDIINVAFAGSRDEVVNAFKSAGWSEADHWCLKTVKTGYMAFNRQAGYATAPASKLYYDNVEADLVFQKSLDTMAKRHHVRIWRSEMDGEEIWLGAATHDIGITFKEGAFSHRIHPKIDYERGKVVDDLAFAGCTDGTGYVDRPTLRREWENGSGIVTDGRLAVVPLRRGCTPSDVAAVRSTGLIKAPRSGASGLARRLVLEGRNYVLRNNVYYMMYDAWRWRRTERERMASVLAE